MRYGALNPVSEGVWLAVMEDDTLLINTFSPMKSREAAGLPGFVEHTLAEHGLKISDIKFWSTWAGPGGFTALRMTAALIAAWALEHDDIKFRCVPAAFALTGRFPGKEGDQLDCLFDILLIATTISMPAALAWFIASTVWGIIPSSAATTSIAISVA